MRGILNNLNKKTIIAAICWLLIIVRAYNPNIIFDEISLILFGISIIVLLASEDLLKYVKKIRYGNFELELRSLSLMMDFEEIKSKIEPEFRSLFSQLITDLEKISEVDPHTAIVYLGREIESIIREIYRKHFPTQRPQPIYFMIKDLETKEIISPELSSIIRRFWMIRNQVLHKKDVKLTQEEMYEMLLLGLRIIKLLSEKHLT
ncbi:hypothetical protein Asulf_00962 [Archaeoglobus sulfaticallidus PM70-1]|uniref:DUF4145 domain-containing protein n=1 Tax=Archaeoglobus sulfaticallidus PM70-1 TaxID=387631 RepID=N0BKE2_9EURY|nr:hypothetical protein [Archaeoglobus sulfaticallidus]AGK60966.1 hypothetical protein Asulf_00962 [Archaeoglobus sulfaticallidus PM70-1]